MSDSFDVYAEWLHIPGGNRAPNHYELLGLPLLENDPECIRNAYWERFSLVRRYEIGNYGERALRLLEELSQAFQCLSDADAKRRYDDLLRRNPAHAETVAGAGASLDDWKLIESWEMT